MIPSPSRINKIDNVNKIILKEKGLGIKKIPQLAHLLVEQQLQLLLAYSRLEPSIHIWEKTSEMESNTIIINVLQKNKP